MSNKRPTRTFLFDTLRFYRTHLRLRNFKRMAEEGRFLTELLLDRGMYWSDCIPEVARFSRDADRLLAGTALLPAPRKSS